MEQGRRRITMDGAPVTLPFDTQQFFAVFADDKAAIWPAQLAGYVLGLATIGALLSVRHRLHSEAHIPPATQDLTDPK